MHVGTRRSLKSLQTQFETRLRKPYFHEMRERFGDKTVTLQPAAPAAKVKVRTCQFIESEPTRADIRQFGSEQFKCGATAADQKPYCTEHCTRCYVKVLTPDEK